MFSVPVPFCYTVDLNAPSAVLENASTPTPAPEMSPSHHFNADWTRFTEDSLASSSPSRIYKSKNRNSELTDSPVSSVTVGVLPLQNNWKIQMWEFISNCSKTACFDRFFWLWVLQWSSWGWSWQQPVFKLSWSEGHVQWIPEWPWILCWVGVYLSLSGKWGPERSARCETFLEII